MARPPLRYGSFLKRATRLVQSPDKLGRLADEASGKMSSSAGGLAGVRYQLELMVALIRAWLKGEYRDISKTSMATVAAGLLYFVVPLDVLPDFILGLGFVDDIAVLGYVYRQVITELEVFARWREAQ